MRSIFAILTVLMVLPAHAATPQRIVSIGGALTEIIYALDAEDRLVGNDTTSYFPEAAGKLPKVGYQRALSAEGIISLGPDLVIMTDEAGPPAVLEQLKSAGVEILTLKAGRSVDSVRTSILVIAQALDLAEKSHAVIARLDDTLAALEKAVAGEGRAERIMFIFHFGGGAPMVAGADTAADSIIALSGGRNVVDGYTGYKPLTPEAAVVLAPDVIVTTSQSLTQTGGVDALLQTPGLALTPAARNGRIIAMDSLYLLGFGPRTAQAALELSQRYKTQ